MNKQQYFIIDFDSTFVTVESLDELARIALEKNQDKKEIIAKIQALTGRGMRGEIPFQISLCERLSLFSMHKTHIDSLIHFLRKNIAQSVLRNKAFFQKHADKIYIISGGFKDYILPIVTPFGIQEDHVLANTFVFDEKGNVIGYDRENLLAQEKGKVKQIQALRLRGDIVVIGDGYTDYEIRKYGLAKEFYAFTENVRRENIVNLADGILESFDELVKLFW